MANILQTAFLDTVSLMTICILSFKVQLDFYLRLRLKIRHHCSSNALRLFGVQPLPEPIMNQSTLSPGPRQGWFVGNGQSYGCQTVIEDTPKRYDEKRPVSKDN